MAEISISELGVQRATERELEQFSQKTIDEHSKINEELKTLAAQKGDGLPQALDYRAEFCARNLGGLFPERFDRCDAKAQRLLHMDALTTFEAEAARGSDSQVKALVASALPHIERHLREFNLIFTQYESK